MEKIKNMVIMRGVPGSGKSTWVKNHCTNHLVCSADDYFTDRKTGEYKFDPTLLPAAHATCLKKAENAMKALQNVVIDNCNILPVHFFPYIELANRYGYTVQIITLLISPEVAAQRCIHGVPAEKIEQRATDLWSSIVGEPCD